MTYEYQPPTTIDDDLQAHIEARDNPAPDSEGEVEDEEAEEPASEDDFQEDGENNYFDENSDWSDEEEGKEYDIVEKYNFVRSECWEEEPKAYMGDSIAICGSADHNQGDGPFRCVADFT